LLNLDENQCIKDVKIGDFGLCSEVLTDLEHHSKGVGTPQYASPEQTRGGFGYGPKSDVYSLGMTLFELACYRQWDTNMERARAMSKIRWENEFPKNHSDCIEFQLVREMCQHNPERRPSAAELLERNEIKILVEMDGSLESDLKAPSTG